MGLVLSYFLGEGGGKGGICHPHMNSVCSNSISGCLS